MENCLLGSKEANVCPFGLKYRVFLHISTIEHKCFIKYTLEGRKSYQVQLL